MKLLDIKNKIVMVDDDIFEKLSKWKWLVNSKGYVGRSVQKNGKRTWIALHRFIDDTPKGVEIDHINRNKCDNRRKNLRRCTTMQNAHNKPPFKGKYKGVFLKKNIKKKPWCSQISYNNKKIHIGYFNNPEDAALAYNEKAKELHGKFAWLNKI